MMVLFYGQNNADIDIFRKLLNELHPSLKFTVEKGKNSREQNFDTFVQVLNFLDVSIILHQNGRSPIWPKELSYLYQTKKR